MLEGSKDETNASKKDQMEEEEEKKKDQMEEEKEEVEEDRNEEDRSTDVFRRILRCAYVHRLCYVQNGLVGALSAALGTLAFL